nr:zinc finger, CCHC-type [Tanacetum cinerariifolium]
MTLKHIFDKAIKSHDGAFWKKAINDEMYSIMGNNTWVLADLPPGCKWIFKRKLKVDGTIEKFKEKLVIQGIRKKSGIDYFDTYAPVARISTKRLLIVLASIYNLIIHQMDVKTAFLNGELDEVVYRNQPHGFIMLVSTPMDTSEKLMPNNGQVVSQLEYSWVIGCLMYAMTCTRPDIAFIVATGKEAEWLRNLILEIQLWSKPIAPISIRCDSAAGKGLYPNGIQVADEVNKLTIRESSFRGLILSGLTHQYDFTGMNSNTCNSFDINMQRIMQNNAAVFQTQETLEEGCSLIDKAWESYHDFKLKDRSLIYWENQKVRLDYRPMHMNTLDEEVETFPPKARVY